MSLFVSYSFVSMENENVLFGNSVLNQPVVDQIATAEDLRQIERQVLATFGSPDDYRWLQIINWKWLPETARGVLPREQLVSA